MKKNNDVTGPLLGGLVLGGLIGGLAALLFAPMKGEDLRQNISSESEKYLEQIREKFTTDLKKTKSATELLVEKAEKIVNLAKKVKNSDSENLSAVEAEISDLKNSIDEENAKFDAQV